MKDTEGPSRITSTKPLFVNKSKDHNHKASSLGKGYVHVVLMSWDKLGIGIAMIGACLPVLRALFQGWLADSTINKSAEPFRWDRREPETKPKHTKQNRHA